MVSLTFRRVHPSASLLFGSALACACGSGTSPHTRTAGAAGVAEPVALHQLQRRPALALAVREGDPLAGLAVAVRTDGGPAMSLAIGSVVRDRLTRGGIGDAELHTSRNGFRIRMTLESGDQAKNRLQQVSAALRAPISGGAELAPMVPLLASAPRLPSSALSAFVECSGDGGLLPDDEVPDLSSAEGARKLEQARGAAAVVSRVAFGFIGPANWAGDVTSALRATGDWPGEVSLPPTSAASTDSVRTFLTPDLPPGQAALHFAWRVSSGAAAAEAVHRGRGSDLAQRLAAFASPWRLSEVGATAHPGWGCLYVLARAEAPLSGARLAESSGLVAALIQEQLAHELASTLASSSPDPWAPARRSADPRTAAELLAFWTFAVREEPTPQGDHTDVVVSFAPSLAVARAAEEMAQPTLAARVASSYTKAKELWRNPVVEAPWQVETAQGGMWLLLASPCGTQGENDNDAGLTALTLDALTQQSPEGLQMFPWAAADSAGVFARAEPRSGETGEDLAVRLGDEVGRALSKPISTQRFARSRASLLRVLGEPVSSEGTGWGALARSAATLHPAVLAPSGLFDSVSHASMEAASVRARGLLAGPMRAAVLANESEHQARALASALDRWIPRSTDGPRLCPPDAPFGPASTGMVTVTLPEGARGAQALLSFPISLAQPEDRELADLARLLLSGSEGLLGRSLSISAAATATARLAGGSKRAVLVVDVRTAESDLEATLEQVRSVLQRVRKGTLTVDDYRRLVAQHAHLDALSRLDPKKRLLDLWSGHSPSPAPSLPRFLEYWGNTFSEARMLAVVAKPKR